MGFNVLISTKIKISKINKGHKKSSNGIDNTNWSHENTQSTMVVISWGKGHHIIWFYMCCYGSEKCKCWMNNCNNYDTIYRMRLETLMPLVGLSRYIYIVVAWSMVIVHGSDEIHYVHK